MSVALEVKEAQNTGMTPEQRLVKALKDEEDRGMAVTREWTDLWRENLRYFFSDQLHGKKRHKDWDWIVVNYIWPSAMQEAAKISQHIPQFTCDPWEEGDADAAEAWQGWLQWTWERGLNEEGMELEQLKAILCGKIYGYRIYKLYWEPRNEWDPAKSKWVGEVKGKLWKPTSFWATGEESIQDGSCGTSRYVDLEYALARWPDYRKQLELEAGKVTEEGDGTNDFIKGQTGSSGTYPGTGHGGSDRGPDYTDFNKLLDRVLDAVGPQRRAEDKTKYVKISETWFKDYTEIDRKFVEVIPSEVLLRQGMIRQMGPMFVDSMGSEVNADNWPVNEKKWKEPKFPNGRYVLRCGDTILNSDEPDQVWPYRLWPFIICPHYIVPFMWQGTDAVQLVKTAQDMINVSVSHLVNHMKQFGDPKIAVERGAIDSPKPRDKRHFRIGSGAGAIIRLAKGGLAKFKILDPPNSSPVIYSLYQLFSQEYKNMVGMQDIAQGKKSAGDLTATEASYLAGSANDRITLQLSIERSWVKRIAQLAAEICQQNYEPERLVRILGENAVPGIMQISQKAKDVKYDIHVQIGSSMPFDAEKRIARYMQGNQLLMGPPSPMLPELFRALDIPNWRKILSRHEIWKQWMAYLQLSEAVKKGEVPPEQAAKMVTQQAIQQFFASTPQSQPGQPGQPGQKPQGQPQAQPAQEQGQPSAGNQ
jgi:hypothetical protein